uniref:Uncharacterized protein TCIL3000_7_2000 n=1 Tax=Trypanosoma congolense (strain IL3000) TaxID=1068625 RepID=G0UPS9_TRYCI|nr:unnamed protein product [Trypanosoma congolense IL3000]
MLKDLNTRCRSGCPGELVAIDDGPRKWMVLNTHEVKLCELHILDRCRYAEECIFLHICKELTSSISGTSADATTTTPLPHVKKDKEGRAGKKSSIFVSISRQQRVCGAPLFYSASEPPEPHYAWAYGAAASNNSASDVNSDSFKAVGCYPIDTAEMGSKRPEAPFPVQQCLAHVQQKARRQSATTPSMTAAASSGDEGAVDSGGSRSFFSLPEQGGLRAATGCANVGYHPYIHNDCHCADCIGYYSSNGCGCCEYCVVNDYGLDSYGQYNYVIDDRHCTSQAAAVGSPSVQHPAAVFLSGRSWHHNPYGSGLKNGAVF